MTSHVFDDAAGGEEFPSWGALVAHLLADDILTGRVYRGMSHSKYRCVTSLERHLSENLAGDGPNVWQRLEQAALSEFRALAGPQLTKAPDTDDLIGWLTVMQHYGAPTRLLDWTQSPFVACYFAYSGMSPDQEQPGALWRLHAPAAKVFARNSTHVELPLRDDFGWESDGGAAASQATNSKAWMSSQNDFIRAVITRQAETDEGRALGVPYPIPVMPDNPDARMVAQQTVLTVDTRLDGGMRFPDNRMVGQLVDRVLLPAGWREEVLTSLAWMGVTAASLFPGVAGVGAFTAATMRLGQTALRATLQSE